MKPSRNDNKTVKTECYETKETKLDSKNDYDQIVLPTFFTRVVCRRLYIMWDFFNMLASFAEQIFKFFFLLFLKFFFLMDGRRLIRKDRWNNTEKDGNETMANEVNITRNTIYMMVTIYKGSIYMILQQ